MSQLTVLHFIWSANFGGIEKQAIELASFQNRGDQVKSSILIGNRKGEFIDLIIQKAIPHYFAGIKSGFDVNLRTLSKLIRLMKNFDIIHFHTFNLLVMIAAVLSRRKIFYTVHGNFNYGKSVRVTDKITNKLRSFLLKYIADFISFNSYWTRKMAIEKFGIRKENHTVIYNGISQTESEINNTSIDNNLKSQLKDKFVVGTASRFNESKKLHRLIEAFAIFSKGKKDVILMLVGDGIQRSQLEKLVRELNVNDKTIFTGFQPDTMKYQNLFDAGVYPFQYEAFGLVVLEALALGKPAIIYHDSGGTIELIENNFKQDIVNSIDDLASRLNFYYQKRNTPDADLVNLRKSISSAFSIELMGESFLKYYQIICNRN